MSQNFTWKEDTLNLMTQKLTIGYFYKEELNLYGDTGNVEIIAHRANQRGLNAEIKVVGLHDSVTSPLMHEIDILFMGGGPDAGQKKMYEDLLQNKGSYIKDHIESGKVGLFICGSYQLLGKYYKSADGSILEGLSVLDYYTQHFGHDKPRCTGNVVAKINSTLLNDPVFSANNRIGATLVGFENHGGRTYLGKDLKSLASVEMGFGNNGEDKTEGLFYKNTFGTYLHGPILSRNPHLADYLIAKSLGFEKLDVLDDTFIISAHTASKKLEQ
jgi:CobQ-like glutamine amidotransferase family enzyme